MALNPTLMKDAIIAKIQSATGNDLPDISETVWLAVSEAIIEHFQANAVVNSNVAVTSVTGVTAGGAVSGPGSGSAVGTIA